MTDPTSIARATEITTAWLANPHTRANPDDVRALLTSVHAAVEAIAAPPAAPAPELAAEAPARPAVGAKASLKIIGRIISMIDGRPYASLTRHLKANGLTPQEYRERFNLPASYPMVAPAYSEARRALAKTLGLGRKPKGTAEPEPVPAAAKPARRRSAGEAKKAAQAHLAGE